MSAGAARQRRGAALAALALALAASAAATLTGAEGPGASRAGFSFATPAGGARAGEAIGALVEMAGVAQRADHELLEALSATQVRFALADAGVVEARQAFAHAAGCWWTRAPGAGEEIIYTRSPRVPQGALSVRWVTSSLRDRRGLEPLVASLLAPWCGGDAGVGYQPAQGLWPATLDAAGHARLVEVLAALERPVARCPDLVPDPGPDLDRPLAQPVRAASWEALAPVLARAAGCSVALAPGTDQLPPPPPLPATSLRAVCTVLREAGAGAAVVRGVLCIAPAAQPPENREHPASRRRLALLPAAHLLDASLDGDFLAAGLERAVAPDAWSQPGWGLRWLADARALLVAADPATIHSVLDAMDRIDHLGLEQGLASLVAPAAAVAPSGAPR